MSNDGSGKNEYFAAALPENIGARIWAKIDASDSWARSSPLIERSYLSELYYQGYTPSSGAHGASRVLRGGEQGELAEVRVNHSRSLAQTLFNLIAAAKVSWNPIATNNDYSAASQAVLARSVLDYYWTDGKVNQYCQKALEESIPLCESFVLTTWDEGLGEPVAVDEAAGTVQRSGDIRFTHLNSRDVRRDPSKSSYEELDWVVIDLRRNRHDLVALVKARTDLPEQQKADLIQEIHNAAGADSPDRMRRVAETGPLATDPDSSDITLRLFLHKPTPAVPFGRETWLVSSKGVLEDGPLSYGFWPLHRVYHSDLLGTPFAYSPFQEILGVQELYDSLQTTVASNQTAFGTQNIIMEQGSEISPDEFTGMRVFYKAPNSADPKALQLCATPQEVFVHLGNLKTEMEQIMGLNSVVRGEPLTGDQSGAALALLQAQAVQQSSALQANYLRFVQSIGNAIIELIKTRCPEPRRIAISGKANSFLQKEQAISGKSIGQIKKVLVEIGNPMAQTAAGRVTMAKELLANQLIKTPEQYIQVIETGRLEPLTQSIQNELLLILKENEQILAGEKPLCSVDDDHKLHAREHRGVMANPDARRDPNIVAAYQAHIQEHEQLYYTADPARLMLMGQEPPMMPPGGAPPPGGPGGPPPGPSGGGAPPSPGAPPPANLPQMPINPADGTQVQPPDGAALGQVGSPPNPGHAQ